MLTLIAPCLLADEIRIEGESATNHQMNRHRWWYDKVNTSELSGGDWISNFNEKKVGTVGYSFKVERDGSYHLHLRVNPTKASLSYRLDAGSWKRVALDQATDVRNIAADGKPDLRFIGWVKAGAVRLGKGSHTIEFRTDSALQNHGAIDLIIFTTTKITPKGKYAGASTDVTPPPNATPPTVKNPPVYTDGDTWDFQPPADQFTNRALLDLRYLNERRAGEHGFIKLSPDGNSFVRGDGQPIRFWSVVDNGYRMSNEDMAAHARFLAKMGVNMVRLHTNIAGTKEGQRITDVNAETIDRIWRYVKACRDNGIYMTISPYWYHHRMPASWLRSLPGYKKGDMPTGALFFNPVYQDAYRKWVTALYKPVNHYTGVSLSKDPTVAIIQVANEDSLLFYTSQNIPAEQVKILGRQYAQWLKLKYGSPQRVMAAWNGQQIRQGAGNAMGKLGDDPSNGFMGMYIIWEMTQNRTGGMDKRLTDQMEFMGRVQRSFYDRMHQFYRRTLGCKQLTNAMNWKSADKLKIDDVERWTYSGMDVMAVNRYAGGVHTGKNDGYRIDPGHHFINRSILKNPLQMPTNLKQVAGHPMIITESTWVRPNLYQSEAGLLAAAYMSLTGVDSLYWFAASERDWMADPRRKFWPVKRGETGYATEKWSCSTQPLQGMWPANALLFRKGYIRQGKPVVQEERSMSAMWQRKAPIIAETATFDPNRDTEDLRSQSGARATDVSRLAFLVGPVEVKFGSRSSKRVSSDLSKYIDGKKSIVRSNTGEIALNWKTGLLTVDAPKAQGVAGFLKDAGGQFDLSDIRIQSANAYATIEVVAMDDRPIKESGKLLVQVGTVARLSEWADRDAMVRQGNRSVPGKQIVATGKPPYQVKSTHATITIANPKLTRATLLNPSGYAEKKVAVQRSSGSLTVTLPRNTMYLMLQ